MQTRVDKLEGGRVRLTVGVAGDELKHAVDHAVADLSQSLRIPGFRRGRVPKPVLISRIGRERVMEEAVESHIGGWFRLAAADARVYPVDQPEYEYELPESSDADFAFAATVAVQELPEPADWTALEVGAPEPEVPREAVDQELEALRHTVAELAPVEGRQARAGDTVVLDIASPETGETNRDVVLDLGAGQLLPALESQVAGMSAGETRDVEFAGADGTQHRASVTLRELKERVLPPLDDELARAASEFDTLDELRGDIESRIREIVEAQLEEEFRTAAIDALVSATRFEPASPLVERRTAALWNSFLESLQRRGIAPESYLRLSGDTPEALVERLRDQARRSLARELVLEAVARKLGLDVSDDEVRELVREQAASDEEAAEAIEELFAHGGAESLREDLRLRKALDRVAAEVKRIAPELAEAREKLWTPEKEETPAAERKLWTPGSKEPV